jgi:UPF0755 protein
MRALAYITLVGAAALVALVNLYPWTVRGAGWAVVELEIPQGASVSQVAHVLSEKGLIVNEDIFTAGAILLDIDRKIVAGKYVLPPRTNLISLYMQLQRGQRHLNFVTVPEGLTLEETSDLLAEELHIPEDELYHWAHDPGFLSDIGLRGDSVEGYLFPDTYDMPPAAHPRDILSTMTHRALETYSRAYEEASSPPELTEDEVFTLASIVEAEVTYHDEAPRVAAVFLNRLRAGMPLQADPTVAYALGGRKKRITYHDLEVDSPYNTYRHVGLPPGPICNPGESSIRAVLNPIVTSDMYFVARGDGRHAFSKTMAEHIKAKREIRRRRAAGRAIESDE